MFKEGKKTVFKDKNKLSQLVNLRIAGFSEVSLSFLTQFNVHYSALIYHFKKYSIEKPEEIYDIPRIVSSLIPPTLDDVWMDIDGEKVNKGRSYQEYLDLSHRNQSVNR